VFHVAQFSQVSVALALLVRSPHVVQAEILLRQVN
jgi:hypothetical protein